MGQIPTLFLSLLSGLFGASISAYFSYRVRLKLQTKQKIDAEQKLAYVYVVQLSKYMAIKVKLQSIFDKIIEQLDTPIPDGEFEFGHALSLLIEDKIFKSDEDMFQKFESVDKLLDQIIDGFKHTYLSNQQQAELPKQTIVFYQRYENHLKNAIGTLQLFKLALSDRNAFKLIDAKQIYNAINTANSLFEEAGLLRAAMIEFGNISKHESSHILTQQYEIFEKSIIEQFEHIGKLDKAREFLVKQGAISANN